MLVSHTHRLLFVHVYKTGGTSIRTALQSVAHRIDCLRHHATAAELRDYFRQHQPEVLKYKWISVVRNPFELNVSLWRHVTEQPHHPDHAQAGQLDFSQFVAWLSREGWLRRMQARDWHLVRPRPPPRYLTLEQFLCGEEGEMLVDEILHTEDLQEEFNNMAQRLGLAITLPHVNQTDHGNYRDYYNAESREIIETHHAGDLYRFGYRF